MEKDLPLRLSLKETDTALTNIVVYRPARRLLNAVNKSVLHAQRTIE